MTIKLKNPSLILAVALTVTSFSANAKGSKSCEIDVADILLDLAYAKAQGDHSALPLHSVTGLIGVRALVSSGLRLRPLTTLKKDVKTVNLVLNDGGSYILDTDGNQHPLITTDSQIEKGIKIRTKARLEFQADGTYRIKLLNFPSLKLEEGGCRLANNLRGSLVQE